MGLAHGKLGPQNRAPLAEINMIPLIDVMLVLLIVFMVAAPLLTHAVKVELPKASSQPSVDRPENIQLGIQAGGELFWNGEPVAREELPARFAEAARLAPQTELQIRADARTPYQSIAQTMAAAATAGLSKIGFVSNPAP